MTDYKTEIEKSCCGILHWNYRNLIEIPEDLREHGKYVENIYLKGNRILQIPKWMPQLENVTELYLYDNHLREIPEEISAMKLLKILDVGRNKIVGLPKTFSSLNSLYVFSANENLIRRLPEDFGKLKSLAFLYLSENCLARVPESISDCNSLQEIVLDFNNLHYLPKSIIYLPNLSLLSLRGNDLFHLPAVPPYSQPKVLLQKCEHLKSISYDFAKYLQDYHVPVEWNFRRKKHQLDFQLNGIAVISETGNSFVLPFTMVYHESSHYPVTLYELCLREVYSLFYKKVNSYRMKTDIDQLQTLPKTIQDEVISGCTALCQNCKTYLFKYAWLKVFEIEAPHPNDDYRVEIVQYFCGPRCSKSFTDNNERHFRNGQLALHELEWNYCG